MFNSLSDRLQSTFDALRGKGRLTEDDINKAMREIRMALLEADVNYRVVKGFVASCKEKCMTAEVLDSLSPAQNVVRIVLDELTRLLGSTESKLVLAQNRTPNVIRRTCVQDGVGERSLFNNGRLLRIWAYLFPRYRCSFL